MVKLNQRPVSRPLKDRLYSPYPATSARNFRPPQEHLNLLIDACKSATCPVHTLLGRIVRLKSVGGNWQVLWVISRKSWKRKNSNLLMVQNWHVSVTWVSGRIFTWLIRGCWRGTLNLLLFFFVCISLNWRCLLYNDNFTPENWVTFSG